MASYNASLQMYAKMYYSAGLIVTDAILDTQSATSEYYNKPTSDF